MECNSRLQDLLNLPNQLCTNLLLHVKNLLCFHSIIVKGFLESRHVQGRAKEEQRWRKKQEGCGYENWLWYFSWFPAVMDKSRNFTVVIFSSEHHNLSWKCSNFSTLETTQPFSSNYLSQHFWGLVFEWVILQLMCWFRLVTNWGGTWTRLLRDAWWCHVGDMHQRSVSVNLIKVWDLFTGVYDVVSGSCRCCRNRCAEALNALGELGGVCRCTLEFLGIMGCCYGNIYGVLASTEKQKLR